MDTNEIKQPDEDFPIVEMEYPKELTPRTDIPDDESGTPSCEIGCESCGS